MEKKDTKHFQTVMQTVCYFLIGISVNTPKISVIYKALSTVGFGANTSIVWAAFLV